jgi:hypothetical protein
MKPVVLDSPAEILRPFILLSVLGFAIGFWAYVTIFAYFTRAGGV